MEFADLNLLDFLKYGALGIALALAILSYRLLSKEQDKEEVREPMLKSIRYYLFFAVILSLFFGTVELVSENDNEGEQAKMAISALWEENFSHLNDSTLEQKINRIRNLPGYYDSKVDTSEVCKKLEEKLIECEQELLEANQGFYSVITKLRKAVDKDPDGWINIEFNKEEKEEIYSTLEKIYISLGESDDLNLSDEKIIEKWKKLKRNWSEENHKYIFRSDVPELVRIYLNKFHPRE
ncbi:MAG: hypothetical protein ACLFT6_06715 [Bacteroidales bacterium]